ncbi:MAG: HepT-like ribonuclease domain-containing protein [Candidatus Thermoplasmatota archaeon]
MTGNDPVLLVEDILEAMNKIEKYTEDKDIEEFTSDSMAVDAVLRNLEVMGEDITFIRWEIVDLLFLEKSLVPWL